MVRKKKSNSLLISGVISALASLAIVAVAPSFAGDPASDKKSGYEDNSSTPQETNQGQGSDHDGDADSDPNTAYEDDHTTADAGDNAHPSGKDRSVENGGSGNQGKSESNPDDSKGPMRYEGVQGDDKPGGPGGTDLADQDGNNGCGNDDDFNDDNNGWCGKPKSTTPSQTCPDGSTMPASGKCGSASGDNVKGNNTSKCPDGSTMVQGKSCSEPDNDGRGPDRNESGRDKVEDGNNGCGNDVDRMDDSEGWCGHKPKDEVAAGIEEELPPGTIAEEVQAGTIEVEADENPATPDSVLGDQLSRDKAAAAPEAGPSVLGIRLSPALSKPVKVAGAVLPFTGGDVLLFLVLALALFAGGVLIMRSTGAKVNES